MQPDPIGYAGGINLYNYALANPIDLTDPFGLQDQPAGDPPQEVIITGRRPICGLCLFLRDLVVDGLSAVNGIPATFGGGPAGKSAPQQLKVDKTCGGSGPAYDPQVQAKALKTLELGQTAQQRNPSGPPFREYGFSGHYQLFPSIFGNGYTTSDIQPGVQLNINLSESYFDTFDVHSHPDPSDNLGPSPGDISGTPSGNTTIIINPDKTLRCYTRP